MEKLPPIEKVYEAWSAIADGRVDVNGDEAFVASSDGTKTYTIRYNPETDTYASNDNATFWRGYAGYPIIAILMLQGRLPYDKDFAKEWAQINWTKLNAEHKRNYAASVEQVEMERNISPITATEKAEKVMDALKILPIKVKRLKI